MVDLLPRGLALSAWSAVIFAALVAAQSSVIDRKLQSAASALDGALARQADSEEYVAACKAARSYLDALGRSSERRATELVLEELKRHESGPFLIADVTATKLFDEVCYQRTRGRPHRMIPPLLALMTRYPDDPRVLYSLGEAFGVASPVFDGERAERYFRELLEVLSERTEVATDAVGRGMLLSQFLPELSRVGLLLEEKPTDTTLRLRQHVLGYCEKLADGHPIGLWRLADPQLDRLYEKLVLARRAVDQPRSREVLEAMLDLQPVNPVLQYLLAEVRASMGPEFDKKQASAHLDEFLKLTDPAILGGPEDRRPTVLTASDVIRDLGRFRLANPRSDLEQQRVAAHELKVQLQDRDLKQGLLLAPDGPTVRKAIRPLQLRLKSKNRSLSTAQRNVDKFEKALAALPNTPRYRARRGEYRQKIKRFRDKAAGYEAETLALGARIERYKRFLK